jgi:hypothetical protein
MILVILHRLSAVWLFYDATKQQILDQDYRTNFAATFFSSRPLLQSYLELFSLVQHRVRGADEDEKCGLLLLLSVLTREASLVLKDDEMVTLKENLVARPQCCEAICNGTTSRSANTRWPSCFDTVFLQPSVRC